jgi:hypothetical protein
MPARHHSSYSTTITWKVVRDPSSIRVVPSARGGIVAWLITLAGGAGMYWVANHVVTIEDRSGLMLWNLICVSTPGIMALIMGLLWFYRDKRPYIHVDLSAMKVSLPRSNVEFSVQDPNAKFVYDVISPRGDDVVCEFNLIMSPGKEEKIHAILRNLGKNSSYENLGRTLQAAGLQFQKRTISD